VSRLERRWTKLLRMRLQPFVSMSRRSRAQVGTCRRRVPLMTCFATKMLLRLLKQAPCCSLFRCLPMPDERCASISRSTKHWSIRLMKLPRKEDSRVRLFLRKPRARRLALSQVRPIDRDDCSSREQPLYEPAWRIGLARVESFAVEPETAAVVILHQVV